MWKKKIEIEVRTFEGLTKEELKEVAAEIMAKSMAKHLLGGEMTAMDGAVKMFELENIKTRLEEIEKSQEKEEA